MSKRLGGIILVGCKDFPRMSVCVCVFFTLTDLASTITISSNIRYGCRSGTWYLSMENEQADAGRDG